MFRYLTLACILTGTVAAAQTPVSTGNAAADALIAAALAEQHVFLTCSSLDATTHGFIVSNWMDIASASAAVLRDNGIAEKSVAAFEEAARVDNLLPAPGSSFAEVKALCDENADWATTFGRMEFKLLHWQLPDAFQP